MEPNVYQTPGSDLNIEEERKGSPVKAILVALVVDIVVTTLLGAVTGFVYGYMLAAEGMTADQVQDALVNGTTFYILSIVTGSVVSIYAGYLCAKIANYREYTWALILGVILIVFSLLISGGMYRTVESVALSLATIACVLTGAWLHVRGK